MQTKWEEVYLLFSISHPYHHAGDISHLRTAQQEASFACYNNKRSHFSSSVATDAGPAAHRPMGPAAGALTLGVIRTWTRKMGNVVAISSGEYCCKQEWIFV